MPKRRMTAKTLAQQAVWRMAGTKAAEARHSWSKPRTRRDGTLKPRGEFGRTRRHKQGGKAYQKHAGGFKINPEIAKVLGHG